MAVPKLENKDKYDFNDVLKEKGVSAVKQQLNDMQKIDVPRRETILDEAVIKIQLETALGGKLKRRDEKTQQSTSDSINQTTEITTPKESEILIGLEPSNQLGHEHYKIINENKKSHPKNKKNPIEILQDTNLGWEKLRGIEDETIQWIVKYRDGALSKLQSSEPKENKEKIEAKKISSHLPVFIHTETTPEEDVAKLYQAICRMAKEIAPKQETMKLMQNKAPEFAVWVAKQNQGKEKQQIPKINWLDKQFKTDWEKLKTVDNSDVNRMLCYVRLSETQKEPEDHAAINKAISKLAPDVIKDKKSFEEVTIKAPELAKRMHTQVRSSHQEKGMEREWD